MQPIAVFTTVAAREDARRIAEALVSRRLAACVQVSAIDSVYVWDGAVQREPEWRLLIKTVAERYDAVEQAVRELHPYELPAIYAMALERVHAPYAAWVAEHSSGPQSSG